MHTQIEVMRQLLLSLCFSLKMISWKCQSDYIQTSLMCPLVPWYQLKTSTFLSSPSPKSKSPRSQSQDQKDLGWHHYHMQLQRTLQSACLVGRLINGEWRKHADHTSPIPTGWLNQFNQFPRVFTCYLHPHRPCGTCHVTINVSQIFSTLGSNFSKKRIYLNKQPMRSCSSEPED